MPAPLPFESVARLPAPTDNVAIAIRRLDVGTAIALPGGVTRELAHTVLEGHRFAIRPIAKGQQLLSWGLPFGTASRAIAAGDYVSNQSMLESLAVRRLDQVTLPKDSNFEDHLEALQLDEKSFKPGPPIDRVKPPRTFNGYKRPGRRGVGTRNFIVILGTTSQTASFARQLAARLQPLAKVHPGIDGIVAIAHTEGGGPGEPNNTTEVLRCLAGFMVHPNAGAVLAVDHGNEPITNERVAAYMRKEGYPLDDVTHQFLSLRSGMAAGLADGEKIVRGWLPAVSTLKRTPEPLSGLRIALQCGGSDAFSGVSGNPLAGAIVHEVIRNGGIGVLTETDESVGAEAYLLKNARDYATARKFLSKIEAFKERLSWHGVTAESNPSGGNKMRGLYNISLKSLGAVHKKDPRTRLEHVIDYAEPLTEPGFYFMNGPGNDLEGIAGQMGSGCNLIIFVTGNGSITNFPFTPTLKVTTTTRRHNHLIHEMDINAGRYLDGESMESLTAEYLDLVIATASGQRTKGEHAGHSQTSLWRNWQQTDRSKLDALRARPAPGGNPLITAKDLGNTAPAGTLLQAFQTNGRYATECVGLVLPTSLCSAQISRLAADRLNAKGVGREQGISRFVALMHTEGCGFGGEAQYKLLNRTYQGYIMHPNVAAALLLEHGCEKIPNDVVRHQLETGGVPPSRFGWASVQMDGGIEKALGNVEQWFRERFAALPPAATTATDLGALSLGLMTAAPVASSTAAALAAIARNVVGSGGSILIPESDALLAHEAFRRPVLGSVTPKATLAYGQPLAKPGFHVVGSETDHWVENVTGLGGCGAHLVLGIVAGHAQQGHPLVPVIQAAEASQRGKLPGDDIDLFLSGDAAADEAALVQTLVRVAQREQQPAALAQGAVDFQLTRGLLGVTT